jgi:pimeloyl-ACP methyl ester carboxylesterase
MRVERLWTDDGIPLTYYVAGTGPTTLVITNAPGMSVRFWTQTMAALENRFRIIALEYRGFPDGTIELSDDQAEFTRHLDDVLRVMAAERASEVHLVSWCLGSKVSWGLLRHRPEVVQSMFTVGPGSRADPQGVATSPFSSAMLGIERRLEEDPEAITSMITLMKRLGVVPDAGFFATIFKEEEDGHALAAIDLLEAESSMSTLAFYLLDNPAGLRNYLKVYQVLRQEPIADLWPKVHVPCTVVVGTEDKITPLTERVRAELGVIPGVRFEEVPNASHFLPIEYPAKLARLISRHIDRATRELAGIP